MSTNKGLVWFKSSRSSGNGQCVEVAFDADAVLVRHSKDPDGPALRFSPDEWAAFIAGAEDGEFRLPR